jgi:hypothetical protein
MISDVKGCSRLFMSSSQVPISERCPSKEAEPEALASCLNLSDEYGHLPCPIIVEAAHRYGAHHSDRDDRPT